ncbi:toxin [Candidatus Kuenenbacteria bacterium RIFCSPHIGHO2_02_FULL_39_13]|uniref:Toxin n=1 Tax=Candidatus Kuenenbacteria bacterium RIFCSPHIGHO2_02_FULL_39_13 TaxID=1798561 RepID=A0A1F6FMR0_9BACT|nr:MAG: toxin [Candidatus Kuenenbacteria bacterium RIFCSPHIGHO2_02_FULL_39_13]
MKYFDWNSQKNEKLREERDIGFEDCLLAIEEDKILDILEHKNKKRYPNQKIFVLEISGYAYLVPFVEDKDKVFLKTIIPSRKATKEYLLKIKNK